MADDITITRDVLRTPRAAAIAGIVFALLLGTALVLVRVAVPRNPHDAPTWLDDPWRKNSVVVALNLVPFAGLAFLWFVGVIRDRIGAAEDRFFATVFLGTGLLFVAMLFVAGAVAGGLIATESQRGSAAISPEVWRLGRQTTYLVLNVYAMRMAGAFTISTTTIGRPPRHPPAMAGGVRMGGGGRAPAHHRTVRVGPDPVPGVGARPEHPPPRPPAGGPRARRRYLRMFTARAITRRPTTSEIASSAIIRSLAHGLIAETSVGLKRGGGREREVQVVDELRIPVRVHVLAVGHLREHERRSALAMCAGRGAATVEVPVPQAECDHVGEPDRAAACEQRLGVVGERGRC